MIVLAAELFSARLLMGFTLAFHIVLACLGVGFPVLVLVAEGLYLRTGDLGWKRLAKRWAKAFAVLFAVGAVSGTVLSFELGLLWPGFMGQWGAVIGLPFTLEGFAFFLEAIFVGIYLYGWDRLPPKVHALTAVPIVISGAASAFFVMQVNAWMHTPRGFTLVGGVVTDVDPIAAMFTPASGPMVAHMLVAAYMVTGCLVASVYAIRRLRGHDTQHERRAMLLALALALPLAPLQAVVGDVTAKMVAKTQPVKFAAMKGQFKTERRAPLRLGGFVDEKASRTPYAIEIPGLLSWMGHGDVDAEVMGLDAVPNADRPPVGVVYQGFQIMVALGTYLIALAAVAGFAAWRRRAWLDHRRFLIAVAASGPAAVIAMEAGWILTEVGRQPWIVQGIQRTAASVTEAQGVGAALLLFVGAYGTIGVGTVVILLALARRPLEEAPGGA